ncbi:MAG: SRPBCC family protein [Taibaiella sp.]|nr:SRPBCC family protein [Taibaiella sp.]
MKTYSLYRTQLLPVTVQTAWDFFSSPNNLAKITPGDMSFVIVSKDADKPIFQGMLIEYRVKPLLGIVMKWVTEIGKVIPQQQFTDTQLKGPYALWQHTHTFEAAPGGVLMTDEVIYALPFGIIGQIAHAILVKSKLKSIFDFREIAIKKYFDSKK